MSIFKNLFKKKSVEKDEKIRIRGPFNFDKFPRLFFEYLEYSKLVTKTYKFSVMDGDGLDVGDKFEKARNNQNLGKKIFAKSVFEIFNHLKPMLENADEEFKQISWDEVFENKSFDELEKYHISVLVGLIDCGYIYVLPKEYYNAEREYSFQYVSLNKMKKLYEETKKA